MDEGLYQKFCVATKGIVADGALQKTAHVLKLKAMPNVVLILRDPAHVIRIACKEPLHRTGRFEEQYKRLFGDRHALLKGRSYVYVVPLLISFHIYFDSYCRHTLLLPETRRTFSTPTCGRHAWKNVKGLLCGNAVRKEEA